METSQKYGFNLPSRDGNDIADINLISDNFRKVEDELNSLDQRVGSNTTNINDLDTQIRNATIMAENVVMVAGEAVNIARMAQETANSADTTAIEAYERSISAESKASEAKVVAEEAQLQSNRVEHISDVISKNKLLYNIEGNNWEFIEDNGIATSYELIDNTKINLSAGVYYRFSVVTPKIGEWAELNVGNDKTFALKYEKDRYVGKIIFEANKTSFSGWIFAIGNDTNSTRLLTSAPIIIEEEILPDRVKIYFDPNPVWEEATNDEATAHHYGKMHVIDNLDLAEDKEYSLFFSVGFRFTDAYMQQAPEVFLVKKTTSGEFVVIRSKVANVENGFAFESFELSSGVKQGEILYLTIAPTPFSEVDTTIGEVFVEWISNTKEILDYLSLKGGNNENLGDIEAALDGIIAIQNNLIGGGSV